jgi:hypothetical protein
MKKFKCECGSNQIEEIMPGVTQSSVITDIEVLEDGSVCMDYGNTNTDGGDIDNIYYQCVNCGMEVFIDELMKLV